MDNADLSGTDLQETTGLKVDQLKKALHWDRALLSADLRRELGLPANGNDTDQRQPKAKH